jgi:hypothetical protein
MKGDELQLLNIEELQKLEQLVQVGLSRVSNEKVCLYLLFLFSSIIMSTEISIDKSFYMFQDERFQENISAFELKVMFQTANFLQHFMQLL